MREVSQQVWGRKDHGRLIMKLSEIIAAVVVILGLAGALQSFFAVDLFVKLVAFAACETAALWVAVRRLKDWVRIKQASGFSTPRAGSPLRLAAAIVALGLICFAFSLGAWLVMWFYAINIEVTERNDKVYFWIRGSRQAVNMLRVAYPKYSESKCKPTAGAEPADIANVDSFGPSPRLDIRNFAHPQSQGIECRSGTTINQFQFEVDPRVEILKPNRRSNYRNLIVSLGGLLWIASISYVVYPYLRSR